MENLVMVPFDVEMAKMITNKDNEGRIVTRDGRSARIICWDARQDDSIVALVSTEQDVETVLSYVPDGHMYHVDKSELDLMIEIPEYMTFKSGDIVKMSNEAYTWLSIVKSVEKKDDGSYYTCDYVSVLINDGDLKPDFDGYSDAGFKIERPTDEERQILIDSLKTSENPKAEEYLKRFFGMDKKPTKEELNLKFEQLSRPLIDFIKENYHPHVTVIIDCGHAELLEGVTGFCVKNAD